MAITSLTPEPAQPKIGEKVTVTAVTGAPTGSCQWRILCRPPFDDFPSDLGFTMNNGVLAHSELINTATNTFEVPFKASAVGDTVTISAAVGQTRILTATHGEFPNHNTLEVIVTWPRHDGTGEGPVRPLIITGPEDTPENRAFNPHSFDKTGRIKLSVLVPELPSGGRVRWSAPAPLAPDTGRVVFRLPNDSTVAVAEGERVEILGLDPGRAAVDVEVRDKNDQVLEKQTFKLLVPQFVIVTEHIDLEQVLQRFGIASFKTDILLEAQGTCDSLLTDANVRFVWTPFGETLPKHLTMDLVTTGEIAGDPVNPITLQPIPLESLPGVTVDGDSGQVRVGPNHFDESLFVYPGAFTNDSLTDLQSQVVSLIQAAVTATRVSTAENALAVIATGRLIGCTLAHETCHSLLGPFFGGDVHTNAPRDILCNGADLTFEHYTGIAIVDPETFPAEGSFSDIGRAHINRPQVNGTLAGLDKHFPVPPTFK